MLYGPPGTGKTYQARHLAASLIRQDILKLWGPRRFFSEAADVEKLIPERIAMADDSAVRRLVRLSRTSIADEMREEHRRRVLGE